MADFVIKGLVIDAAAGAGAGGLTVLVVHDQVTPSYTASTATNADGSFEVPINAEDIDRIYGVRGSPNRTRQFAFTILIGSRTLLTEAVALSLAQLMDADTDITFTVDLPDPSVACVYTVFGKLRQPDGVPIGGATIDVLQKLIRTETSLGTSTTNAQGEYIVRYTQDSPCDPDRPNVDLFVTAVDSAGRELARSDLLCDVPSEVEVDLVEGNLELRGPAALTASQDAIAPHLDTVVLADLTLDDVNFLACKTELEPLEVALVASAAKLEAATSITRNAFFAIGEQQPGISLTAILSQDPESVRVTLESAADRNIVPPWAPGEVDQILDALKVAALDASVPPSDPQSGLIGQLFATAGLASTLPRTFLEAYVNRPGTVEQFWIDFRASEGDAATDAIQRTLQIGTYTQNHIPLVQDIQGRFGSGQFSDVRELARLDTSEWETILSSDPGTGVIGTPQGFPGADQTKQIAAYARTLVRVFEDAYPEARLAEKIRDAAVAPDVEAFLDLNPTFQIRKAVIDDFMSAPGAVIPPGADTEPLTAELKRFQRLFTVSPRFGTSEATIALFNDGIHSAQQIDRMGEGAFVEKFKSQLGGAGLAKLVYDAASKKTAMAATVLMKFSNPFRFPELAVIPGFDPVGGIPNLETLFGSQDFCKCEECRSVLSPAAYLVDILQFLRDRPLSGGTKQPYDELLDRRPEICNILLNCENTNTVLCKIDLVNEILENAIRVPVAGPPPDDNPWPQTTLTADELLAQPENINVEVYETDLKTAKHPFILPFDLFWEEARVFLKHLGVPRAELFRLFRGDDPGIDVQTAFETVGLSPGATGQGTIVTTTETTAAAIAPFWGLPEATLVATLTDVETFLARAQISFDELRQLVATDYVGAGQLTIDFVDLCDLGGATMGGLAVVHLDRAHRFLRLQQTLGWTIPEVDAAIAALAAPGTDPLVGAATEFMRSLARFLGLAGRFQSVPRLELLSWFGLLDTRRGLEEEPSFYEQKFVDRRVNNPPNPDFELKATGTDVVGAGLALSDDHRVVLRAALEISAPTLQRLLDASGFAGSAQLSLDLISRLHRRVSLARALGISVDGLLKLATLAEVVPVVDDDPFAGTAAVRTFVTIAKDVLASPFSVDELRFLLRHEFDIGSPVPFSNRRIANILTEIVRALQQVLADTSRAADDARPSLEILEDKLGAQLGPDDASLALRLVAADDTLADPAAVVTTITGILLPTDTPVAQALGTPFDGRSVEARANDLLDAVFRALRETLLPNVVAQKVAESFGLERDAAAQALSDMKDGDDTLTTVLTRESFTSAIDFEAQAGAISSDDWPVVLELAAADQFVAARRLDKAARIIRAFDLSAGQLESLRLPEFTPAPLVLDQLQALATSGLFGAWNQLRRYALVRDALFDGGSGLVDFMRGGTFEGPLLPDTLQLLADLSGLDLVELTAFASLLPVSGADIKSIDGFFRIADAFRISDRIAVGATQLETWANPPEATQAIAKDVRNAAKARHPQERWPSVAAPIQDILRERQRDALVGFILADPATFGATDRDDLLRRFLIDVEVTPCVKTSRIKAALSAVQLFAQRINMNLEPDVRFSEQSSRDWSFLKKFRLWEANRRIFLFPENFVEPDLRDDKTELFEELEDALCRTMPRMKPRRGL